MFLFGYARTVFGLSKIDWYSGLTRLDDSIEEGMFEWMTSQTGGMVIEKMGDFEFAVVPFVTRFDGEKNRFEFKLTSDIPITVKTVKAIVRKATGGRIEVLTGEELERAGGESNLKHLAETDLHIVLSLSLERHKGKLKLLSV